MKRDIFNKVIMALIFLALVANLIVSASGTKQTMAQERKRSPEYAIALSIKEVARALEQVAASNNNIAESIASLGKIGSE